MDGRKARAAAGSSALLLGWLSDTLLDWLSDLLVDGLWDSLVDWLIRYAVGVADGIGDWQDGVVYSYVVEAPDTGDLTDFFSFYSLPSTVINNPLHKTLRARAEPLRWPDLRARGFGPLAHNPAGAPAAEALGAASIQSLPPFLVAVLL